MRDNGRSSTGLHRQWQLLQERGFGGWITLDLDPPRANEGEGSIEEKLRINARYVSAGLGVAQF